MTTPEDMLAKNLEVFTMLAAARGEPPPISDVEHKALYAMDGPWSMMNTHARHSAICRIYDLGRVAGLALKPAAKPFAYINTADLADLLSGDPNRSSAPVFTDGGPDKFASVPIYAMPEGTYACPICGIDSPHTHFVDRIEWVDVDDRLPERGQHIFLAWHRLTDLKLQVEDGYFDGKKFVRHGYYHDPKHSIGGVAFWMPKQSIPAPPASPEAAHDNEQGPRDTMHSTLSNAMSAALDTTLSAQPAASEREVELPPLPQRIGGWGLTEITMFRAKAGRDKKRVAFEALLTHVQSKSIPLGDTQWIGLRDALLKAFDAALAQATPQAPEDVKDAARYRFIRDSFDSLDDIMLRKSSDGTVWRMGESLDAAIDAALANKENAK